MVRHHRRANPLPQQPVGFERQEYDPTHSLNRQIANARRLMGEARWAQLNAEWDRNEADWNRAKEVAERHKGNV